MYHKLRLCHLGHNVSVFARDGMAFNRINPVHFHLMRPSFNVTIFRTRLQRRRRSQTRSKLKCYWTRASCDCGRLQIGFVTQEMKFLSNDPINPNTNPKTLTTLTLTLTDPHGAFENSCLPVFCDFVRNCSCTVNCAIGTSIFLNA